MQVSKKFLSKLKVKEEIKLSGGFRTKQESEEGGKNSNLFNTNKLGTENNLENFPKYVRRQNLTRFLALYELFKLIKNIKGSIIECGVNQGFGLMSWAKFSAILEPTNFTRRVYGFDSFDGFPSISNLDKSNFSDQLKTGDLRSNSYNELNELINIFDSTRFIGHIKKVNLIKGDATQTIPKFVNDNPHAIFSLVFLDFDLYEPTKTALNYFLPRMPKGAILAFDELDNPLWPGETLAMLEFHKEQNFQIQRFDFDPYIGYIKI